MDEEGIAFLKALADESMTNSERAVAALWHADRSRGLGLTVGEIAEGFERAGYPRQNRSRMQDGIRRDKRTRKLTADRYGISVARKAELDSQFAGIDPTPRPTPTNSMLPASMFWGTRGYIEKVVLQINASFDAGLYDCTAVMSRRLVETLIIEAYEHEGRGDELKGPDSHYLMLSGLVAHVESDPYMKLGRESMRGLKALKALGDRSAHNRRFNARRDDLTRVRDGLRLVSEELLHLAGLS